MNLLLLLLLLASLAPVEPILITTPLKSIINCSPDNNINKPVSYNINYSINEPLTF
jgi:hypothetical protein